MPRASHRFLAVAGVVALGAVPLSSCASESRGVDVSGDWPSSAATAAAQDDAPSMLVFGDSWTFGLAASTPTGGYAYLAGLELGWNTTVDGENGSGYLHPGEHGGLYGTRVVQLDPELDPDLVVVQGSINDRASDLSTLSRAANGVWEALERMYPDADLVILGPAPATLPVDESVERIDEILGDLAQTEGLDYISPLQEQWITKSNYDTVIDSSSTGHYHPSDTGHAYLAEKLAEHISEIAPEGLAIASE